MFPSNCLPSPFGLTSGHRVLPAYQVPKLALEMSARKHRPVLDPERAPWVVTSKSKHADLQRREVVSWVENVRSKHGLLDNNNLAQLGAEEDPQTVQKWPLEVRCPATCHCGSGVNKRSRLTGHIRRQISHLRDVIAKQLPELSTQEKGPRQTFFQVR